METKQNSDEAELCKCTRRLYYNKPAILNNMTLKFLFTHLIAVYIQCQILW